jgi:hypothetical protein
MTAAGGRMPADVTRETVRHAAEVTRSSGEAKAKLAQLLHMIGVLMPQWENHPKMPLNVAVRRFWPGGRAAR